MGKGNIIHSEKSDEELVGEYEIIEYVADKGRLTEGLTNLIFDEFFSVKLKDVLASFLKNLSKENNSKIYLKFANSLLRDIRKCIEIMVSSCDLDEVLVDLYEDGLKEYFKSCVLDVG